MTFIFPNLAGILQTRIFLNLSATFDSLDDFHLWNLNTVLVFRRCENSSSSHISVNKASSSLGGTLSATVAREFKVLSSL